MDDGIKITQVSDMVRVLPTRARNALFLPCHVYTIYAYVHAILPQYGLYTSYIRVSKTKRQDRASYGSGLNVMVVDTNVFLETMLNQERADECEAFLMKIAVGELSVVVSRFSIHAIEAIIGKGEMIGRFLRDVNSSNGLRMYDTDTEDEIAVTLFLETSKLDFDDALQYFVAKKLGAESIISFDRGIDNLDIKRLEPIQVI